MCYDNSPDFSPGDTMIAPDFLMCAFHGAHPAGDLRLSKSVPDIFVRQRVPATESIVIHLGEGARARWRKKDKQGRIKRSLL